MSHTKTGIKKVAIYDPATGTVVQINNLAPEGEIAMPTFNSENSAGNMLYAGNEFNFEFVSYELGAFTQLETWMKNETQVRLVVLGIEENILWYESSEIYVKKQYGAAVGGRNGYLVGIRFAGYTTNIITGMNLLHMLNGWIDANTDEVADGYTAQGVALDTKDFNDATLVQNLGSSTGGVMSFYAPDIIFPIAGADLQLSYDKVSLTTPGALTLEIDQHIYSGFDSMNNVALTNAILTFTTVANFWKMIAKIIDGTASAGFDIEMKHPYLGVPLGEHQNILY